MTEPNDRATYRVIEFGSEGTEALLTRSQSGVLFPEVIIPRWERLAENVTSEMKREWGEVVICLSELDSALRGNPSQYIVVRHWRRCGTPSVPLLWIPVADLSGKSFAVYGDYWAMRESLAHCRASVCDADKGPFARLNWFEELCEWVGQTIASRGLHLTGDFRQLNASSTFSLIRFETNGPAMWFKAVGKPNQREFPITLQLAKDYPRYMPEIVAARGDWTGWLTCEATGTNLAETLDLSFWKSAAAALAKLQIESIDDCGPLLDAGAHDLNAATLAETVAPFLEVIAGLMEQQPKSPPLILSKGELSLLKARICDALSALDQLEIPDALGHLDLNPGNIIVGVLDKCVFLDWTEACVGHPFDSFQYVLEHFRRLGGENAAAEEALTTSYLAPWSEVAPRESLIKAMELAPLVAAFAYAVRTGAWRQPERLRDPKVAGYLRALARRMNREADQLGERRAPCLS